MYTFLCENSIDGIFTGIYDAWASRYGHKNIRLHTGDVTDYELFQEYIQVTPDTGKSTKVADTIRRRLGDEVYLTLCQAILANELHTHKNGLDKADCIYRALLLGFSMPDGSKVLDALNLPYIHRIFELSRATSMEAHHLLGFLRFSELTNGVLFATIHPKNYVLPLLAEHFTDRLPQENFLIYDENRRLAVLHRAGSSYLIADASSLNEDMKKRYSGNELEYRKLWCCFFDSIAIEARCNPALQSQNIPLRFRKDTVELSPDAAPRHEPCKTTSWHSPT